jgi:hypothetical protein
MLHIDPFLLTTNISIWQGTSLLAYRDPPEPMPDDCAALHSATRGIVSVFRAEREIF